MKALKFKKAHELASNWSSYKSRKKYGNWKLTYRDFFSLALKSLNRIKANSKTVLMSIKNQIAGTRQDRGTMFNFTGDFTKIMQKADVERHFVGAIIQKAIDGSYISEKQAWAVAYYASK